MLKKCLKHEWKASWKGMAGINGAALALGLLGSLGILGTLHNMRIPDLVVVLYMFAYIVILVAHQRPKDPVKIPDFPFLGTGQHPLYLRISGSADGSSDFGRTCRNQHDHGYCHASNE